MLRNMRKSGLEALITKQMDEFIAHVKDLGACARACGLKWASGNVDQEWARGVVRCHPACLFSGGAEKGCAHDAAAAQVRRANTCEFDQRCNGSICGRLADRGALSAIPDDLVRQHAQPE